MVGSVLINCSFNFGLPYGQYIPNERKYVSKSPREETFCGYISLHRTTLAPNHRRKKVAGKLRQFWRRVGIEGRSRYIRLLLPDYQHSLLAVIDIYVRALFRKHWLHGQFSNRTPIQEECS